MPIQIIWVFVYKRIQFFPENEIDFFDALKHYRVDEYSQIAQELAEQVEDYMNTLFFERVEFQIVIKP
jgi:hypothetical protein